METQTQDGSGHLYGGVSGVKLDVEFFPMGEGIELRQTYCHLFSTNMMAFSPPGPAGYHEAPWKAAKGGFGYDITVEIRAPAQTKLGESFDAKELIWWIAALLRMANFPYLSIPVISDQSFRDIPNCTKEPHLVPFETEGRILGPTKDTDRTIGVDVLAWVAENWLEAGQLLNNNPKFYSALKAFDSATLRGRASASMLALWGGLEQLFLPSQGELRFRVSALLASYLEQPGNSRYELFRHVHKLYGERCSVAHTANDVETAPLIQTYIIMRNALMKMIEEGRVPTKANLESLLFGFDAKADD